MRNEKKLEICDFLLGTCLSEHVVAERFDVTDEEVLEAAGFGEVERCLGCDWWFESHELDDNFVCEDCQ